MWRNIVASVVVEAKRLKCSSALSASFFYAARILSRSQSKAPRHLILLDRERSYQALVDLVLAVQLVVASPCPQAPWWLRLQSCLALLAAPLFEDSAALLHPPCSHEDLLQDSLLELLLQVFRVVLVVLQDSRLAGFRPVALRLAFAEVLLLAFLLGFLLEVLLPVSAEDPRLAFLLVSLPVVHPRDFVGDLLLASHLECHRNRSNLILTRTCC